MNFNLLSIASGMSPALMEHSSQIQHHVLIDLAKSVVLRHHRSAFTGCFSMFRVKNINWEIYKAWKENPTKQTTGFMANHFAKIISNSYSFITTPPPSAKRDPKNYCTYNLARAIALRTSLRFIPTFQQRLRKTNHGRFASLSQNKPQTTWYPRKHSILLIDDCITSGNSMKQCYQILKDLDNHIDGLVFMDVNEKPKGEKFHV